MSINLRAGKLLVDKKELRELLNGGMPTREIRGVFSEEVDASQSLNEIESLEREKAVKRLTKYNSAIEIFKVPKGKLKRLASKIKQQAKDHIDVLDCNTIEHHMWLLEFYCYVKNADQDIYIFN